MYKKAMQVPDALLLRFAELCGDLDLVSLAVELAADPVTAHRSLARDLVRITTATSLSPMPSTATTTVAKGGIPSDIPEVLVPADAAEGGAIGVLRLATQAGPYGFKCEARRLIQNRGLKIDGETVEDWRATVDVLRPRVLQKGKDRFVRCLLGPV